MAGSRTLGPCSPCFYHKELHRHMLNRQKNPILLAHFQLCVCVLFVCFLGVGVGGGGGAG